MIRLRRHGRGGSGGRGSLSRRQVSRAARVCPCPRVLINAWDSDLVYSLRWTLSAAAVAAGYIVAVRYGGVTVRAPSFSLSMPTCKADQTLLTFRTSSPNSATASPRVTSASHRPLGADSRFLSHQYPHPSSYVVIPPSTCNSLASTREQLDHTRARELPLPAGADLIRGGATHYRFAERRPNLLPRPSHSALPSTTPHRPCHG